METQILVREEALVGGSEGASAITLTQDLERETTYLVNDFGRLYVADTAKPETVGGTVRPQVRSSAGLVLGIAANIGKYLMDLDIRLSGPPLTQRERIGLEIRVAEKFWGYWVSR